MSKGIKTLAIILFSVIFLMIISALVYFYGIKAVDYDELIEVRIKQCGTMVPIGDEYILSKKSDTWIASHNRMAYPSDNTVEAAAGQDFAKQIVELLAENHAHWWDGFDYENIFATDGSTFSFHMRFADEKEVEAEGYMLYPRNFFKVWNGFEDLYEELFEQ